MSLAAPLPSHVPAGYRGEPFRDEHHPGAPQVIPGRVECALYDLGGEGVAFHDPDPVNRGSGEYNQQPEHQRPHASPYHWNFRRDEALDLSYVKDTLDLSHPGLFLPEPNQLYIGWTSDGEWVNYTVEVRRAGTYRIHAAYSNRAQSIRFSVDGRHAATCQLPVDTGDWHSWNRAPVGTIELTEPGLHLLTFHYDSGSNFAFFDFEPTAE